MSEATTDPSHAGGEPGREAIREVSAADGYRLRYRFWGDGTASILVVMQHGILTHSGWLAGIAEGLVERGMDVLGHDRRGSGMNGEARGDAAGADQLLDDLHLTVAPNRPHYRTVIHFGWCLGCTVGLRYLAERPEMGEGIVLMSPDVYEKHLRPAVMETFSKPTWDDRVLPRLRVPVAAEIYTDGPALDDFVRPDPLKLVDMTPRLMRATVKLKDDVERMVGEFRKPSLLILAARDRIIDNERTRRLYAGIGSPDPRVLTLDCNHGIQFEALDELVEAVAGFAAGVDRRMAA
jgi:acylglycerol lipase